MKKFISGFTYVEFTILLVIIVIMVIAIPKLLSPTTKARITALNGLVLAINHAATLTAAQYQSSTNSSQNTNSSVPINGQIITVMVGTGYPTANKSGIGTILPALAGFSATYQANSVNYNFNPPINGCSVIYNAKTGKASANSLGC
jgi:Tfp pilus assembly major pilin PilA